MLNIRFDQRILTCCDLEADFALRDVDDVTSYENLCRQTCEMKAQIQSYFNVFQIIELHDIYKHI